MKSKDVLWQISNYHQARITFVTLFLSFSSFKDKIKMTKVTTASFYNLRTLPEDMALNLRHLDVTPCLEIKPSSYFKVDVTGGACDSLLVSIEVLN